MEYSDQVVKVLSECVATAMKKAMSDTSRAIEEKLRNYKFSGGNIKPMSIDNTHIQNASIDVAKVKNFMAEVANIAVANIKSATIDTAQIRDLAAYTANIANANIKNATIKFAQIEGLTAGSALIQEAVGDKVMIADLAVTEANMVSLTLGSLVLKGKDGSFYSILVGEDGQVKTELKQIVNSDIKDLSLNAGEKLIEGSITAACLNVKEIFANKALIGAIRTVNLDAAEITANKAFIEQLATSLIESPDDTGLKLASQNFVTLHVPGELKNASVTVDKNGVEITGGKIIMDASTAIDILSGGALNVNGGSVSIGANSTIALTSGGTMTIGSGSSIKINSGAALDVTSGSVNVSSGTMTLSGSTIQMNSSTLALKSDGKMNIESGGALNVASGGAVNIAGGTIALTSSATLGITGSTVNINSGSSLNVVSGGSVKVSGGTLSLESSAAMNIVSGTLSVQSGSSVSVNTGGTFTIGSGNFSIDASGNVTMTGKVTASSGKIGGWNIDTDRLYAGSGASYVALNTNASYPAIWAGNGTYSSAPFRVYQDGSVYITSLYALKEDGTQEKVDLRSSYWKMDSAYSHAVKTLSVTNGVLTIALNNGTTVNFNKADLSGLKVSGWSWPLNTATDYSSANVKVTLESAGIIKSFETSLNTTSFVNHGKKLMSVEIDPEEAVTLSPGGSQRVHAKLMDGDTVSDSHGVTISAATISKVGQTGASTLNTSTSLSCKIRVTASNGWYHDFDGVIIGAVPAYDEGYKKGKEAISLVMDPIDGSSVSLGFGASKTITAKMVDGSTQLKTASVTVKAPAKPTIVLGITPGSKTLGYGEVQTVTATVKENGTEVKKGTATITAPPAPPTVTGVSFGAPSLSGTSDLKFSVSVTYSDGTSVSLGEKSINGSASYKAGQDSMGLSISGTTVSVAVSETKSATASVGSSHRIQSDGSVSLTPGKVFNGAPGTYYKNPRIVADHWINWT